MAIRPDYDIGTVTLTANSADFTTTGAALEMAAVQAGDAIITTSGHVLIIASITGQNAGTLFLPCPTDAAGDDLPLRIRFQPDGSRYQGAVRNMIDLLYSGNVEAFSALVGAAGMVPIFTGAGTMTVISKQELTQGVYYDVQVNTLADRDAYDFETTGFTVLVSDVGDGRSAIYSKASAAAADWTAPAFLTGPSGSFQSRGVWSASTSYNLGDVVFFQGSSWIAKVDNTNQYPPSLPIVENAYWVILSEAGNTFVIRGVYENATAYLKDDVVYDNGSSWIALQATTGNAPPTLPQTSNTYWNILSSRGNDGEIVGPLIPQGRLTLTSGVAITTTDVSGQTTIYYTPCAGNRIPIYDGTNYINTVFAELSLALDATTTHTNYHEGSQLYDCFVFNDGGTIRLGTGPKWATMGAGTSARGTGAGTTELEFFNGFNVNKSLIALRYGSGESDIVSIPARQATYVGTFLGFAVGQAADTATRRFLFNAYNQAFRVLEITDPAATWTYSTDAWRQSNGNVYNQISIVSGLSGIGVSLEANSILVSSGTDFRVALTGIGINSTTANSGKTNRALASSTLSGNTNSTYRGYTGLGYQTYRWLERGAGVDTQTWRGTNSASNAYTPGLFGEVWL